MISYMVVDSILHIDCKHENLGANDNDLIKTDSIKIGKTRKIIKKNMSINRVPVDQPWITDNFHDVVTV